MIRYLIGIVVSLIAFTFIRAVWGILQKAIVDEVGSSLGGGTQPPAAEAGKPPASANTTLRKCVTCGTYKAESSMIRYGGGDKSLFVCSADCERKAAG